MISPTRAEAEMARLKTMRSAEPQDSAQRWWINGAICALSWALEEHDASGESGPPVSECVDLFKSMYRPGVGDLAGDRPEGT